MDLSKFYFLGEILNDIHNLETREYNEIVGYPAVIWENHGFEGRYGHGNDTVLDNVKNIYTIYEKHLQEFLKTDWIVYLNLIIRLKEKIQVVLD